MNSPAQTPSDAIVIEMKIDDFRLYCEVGEYIQMGGTDWKGGVERFGRERRGPAW